ncbi:MAG: CoB--CoM heterodisulfide reductase iron-sulfur subunit A family protein [Candidatus Bathyarchaeia archaeon]
MSENVRIGVFICHCGMNIAKSVDVKTVREYASTLPGVVYAEDNEFTCSEAGQEQIRKAVKEHNLNRVVVASCSPKLHEPTFRRVVSEAGLNPFLFEMANIREHCSWPHYHEGEKATEKAKRIVAASVERARWLEPIGKVSSPVKGAALVIGGGPAGMHAALSLADYGFDVHLVERQPFLGGRMLQLGKVFPTEDCSTCTSPMGLRQHRRCLCNAGVLMNPRVKTYLSSEVKSLEGYIGNFKATIRTGPLFVDAQQCIACGKCEEVCPVEVPNEYEGGLSKRKAIFMPHLHALPYVYVLDPASCNRCGKCVEACPTKAINLARGPSETDVEVGALVVATGFDEYKPKGLLGYGEYPDVVTQQTLASMLDPSGPTHGRPVRPSDGRFAKRIAMVQCVGSRDPKTHAYCSKICCMIALKHARSIKERDPDVAVTVFYKDIRLPGRNYEDYYYDCEKLGVNFVWGDVVGLKENEQGLELTVSKGTGGTETASADLAVLSSAMVPSQGTEELARKLGLSLGADGFFSELHPKLAPIDTRLDGIFLAGGCQGPKDIVETLSQAEGVASRAAILMAEGQVEMDLAKARVDESLCIGCANCVYACPYRAIEMTPSGVAKVIEVACKGCGICAAECPAKAMTLRHFRDEQFDAAIHGILTEA